MASQLANRRKPDDGLLISSWALLESTRKKLQAEDRLVRARARGLTISYQVLEDERKELMQRKAQLALKERQLRSAERNLRWLLLWSLLMGMALMGWIAIVAVRFL